MAMASILERMDMFAEAEPRICVWCRHCGIVLTGPVWGYVCIRSCEDITRRVKSAIKPFPPNTGGKRTRLQCVNADEWHEECFVPTKLTDRRIRLMDMLGLMPVEGSVDTDAEDQ